MVMTPQQLAEIEALAGEVPEDEEPKQTRPRVNAKATANVVDGKNNFAKPAPSAPRNVQEEFTINKGAARTIENARLSWPFRHMEVGHWFTVTNEENFQRARVSASAYGKRNGKQFTCKMDTNNHLLVQRVK